MVSVVSQTDKLRTQKLTTRVKELAIKHGM